MSENNSLFDGIEILSPAEVQAALQSALRLDAARIVTAFSEAEKENLPFK